MTWDARARADACALLGPPDGALLERASQLGLSDPEIARTADALVEIALAGCARLGEHICDPEALEAAREYCTRRTVCS